ncbi:hypothetical protein FRC03_006519 [Tulasnella sp. 419]|nr:hypothetical protein FRC03_006519 [Tulasnella sp. 419]
MANLATRQIAMVCNHWYDIVISTPQLWSYLDAKQSIEKTSIHLRRSRASPLHIYCPIYKPHLLRFMEVIVPHAYCWKSFIATSRSSELFEGGDMQPYSAPLLEQFILPVYDSVRSQLLYVIIQKSPNLRKLHIPLYHPSGLHTLSRLTNLSVSTGDGTQGISM